MAYFFFKYEISSTFLQKFVKVSNFHVTPKNYLTCRRHVILLLRNKLK